MNTYALPTTRAELARFIDHTFLKPEATPTDIHALVMEASDLGTYSICISPNMLASVRNDPAFAEASAVHPALHVATVCGFPSGAHASTVKAVEAAQAVAQGAEEVDMVVNLAYVVTNDWFAVEQDIACVRQAIPTALLKVILETALLTDEQITECCFCAERAGADYVKTSTGFHPAGGASVHAIDVMVAAVGGRLGIKASGGIRDTDTALAMIAAGATRLGLSSSRTVLAGMPK